MPKKETMTPRERVHKALNHEIPDRVPIDLGGNQTGIHKNAYRSLIKHLGIADEIRIMDAVQQLAAPCEQVLQRFHVDTRYVAAGAADELEGRHRQGAARRAQLGRPDRRVRHPLVHARGRALLHGHHAASAGQGHPGATSSDYPWPKGDDPSRFAGLRERALTLKQETPYAVVSGISGVVYEICWYLRGLEQWFCDLMGDPEFCEAMLDQTLKFWLDWFRLFLDEVGDVVDVIMIGDDLAGQNGPLFNPAIYRRIVKPRHKRLVQYIRSRTQAKIWYHTCGACMDFIPDLIDNGVHILNPVQVSARNMDPVELKRRFGRQICVLGRRRGCPARPAPGHAARSGRERAPEREGAHARRRLRLQQRPQHPGRSPAGEHRGAV